MKCKKCKKKVNKEFKFCSNCGIQVRCQNCNRKLTKKSKFCSSCGATTIHKIESEELTENKNTIEFEETLESRKLRAEFTDSTAKSFGSLIGGLLYNRLSEREVIPSIVNDLEIKPPPPKSSHKIESNRKVMVLPKDSKEEINLLSGLEKIFVKRSNKWSLGETELKAKNWKDQGRRVVLLFLLFSELRNNSVNVSEMNQLLKNCGLYDRGVRSYMSRNTDYNIDSNQYNLTSNGRDEAEAILKQVLNSDVESTWTPNSSKTTSSKRIKKNNSRYKSVELELSGEERLEMKKSYDLKNYKNKMETLLPILHFWKEKKNLDGLDYEKIYNSFKVVGALPPGDIPKTLREGLNKGWFKKTGAKKTFAITSVGEEHLKSI